ncbi:hypothetical protein MC885_004006 [Smutsia gigantea]|nr:hypothetical protein MC885_004006 [Smutsia gigantea]
MAASRRLMKELEEIRKCGMKNFRNIQVDEANLLTWQGLIVPDNPPYDKGAFRIEINFPAEYPFKPPKITFKTKIYHPNIDEKGQVCLPVISAENWKPATKTDQVIQSLIALVNDPQPEHPLRADLAEEYSKDRKKFCKNAEEFTKKYGEKRPTQATEKRPFWRFWWLLCSHDEAGHTVSMARVQPLKKPLFPEMGQASKLGHSPHPPSTYAPTGSSGPGDHY